MTLNTTKVNTDGTTLEKKLFDAIMNGAVEQHLLLPLISNVSSQFNPGTKSFEVFQWGQTGTPGNTPEDGNEISGSSMPIYSDEVACDQDKIIAFYEYDKATYLSAVNYAAGFMGSAGFQFARLMETYVAGLMRTAAEDALVCKGALGQELNEENLEDLAIAMDDAKLPKEGRRLIVTPRQKHALIRAFNLKDAGVAGGTGELRNAFISRLYGFDIYEGNTNILPVADANQALAFVSSACWWGLGINPTVERERQATKARTAYTVRARYGAKVNELPDADNTAQTKIWLVGKDV